MEKAPEARHNGGVYNGQDERAGVDTATHGGGGEGAEDGGDDGAVDRTNSGVVETHWGGEEEGACRAREGCGGV